MYSQKYLQIIKRNEIKVVLKSSGFTSSKQTNLSRAFFWKSTVINRNQNDKTIFYVQCMFENNDKVFKLLIPVVGHT